MRLRLHYANTIGVKKSEERVCGYIFCKDKENAPRSGCGTSPNDGSSDSGVDSSHLDSRHIRKQCNSHLPATAAGKATDDLSMLCHKKATGYDVHLLRCFICMKNASVSHVGYFWFNKCKFLPRYQEAPSHICK